MTRHSCPKCGATLPGPGATCPRCLLDLALADEPVPQEPAPGRPRKAPVPPPSPAELAPLFPELELESLLGEGGMGVVYKARQKRLGRAVALKVLHGELSGDPGIIERSVFAERFLREAQALAKLAHPGIVAVHDYGERAGRCFLVMEYVDGANLRALLKRGLLAPRQALDIVRQLCDALQFAHDEGIVHRDIKPENVLVDTKGRVKVADFGLAKLVGAPASVTLTDAGQVMGTPHYMAPEQIEHPRDVDHRADIYSLGVVFYEMLTGELPLGRFAPPSMRVEVDVRLDQIVLRTLEHERERRYQNAVEVRTDVESVQHGPARARPAAEGLVEDHEKEVEVLGLALDLSTDRPSAAGWLVILFVAWLITGAVFNLGQVPFAAISLVLLTWLFFALVRARSGVEPPDKATQRWNQRLAGGLLVGFGQLALFTSHVASFERWTWHYVSNDQAPTADLDQGWRANDGLLERVGLARSGSSSMAEIDSGHWLGNPYELFGVHPLAHLAVAGLLFLLAALAIQGRRLEDFRSGLPEAARVLGLWLGALALVHGLTFVVHGTEQSMVALAASRSCRGEAAELAQAAYGGLIARGFEVHAEHHGRLVDVPGGEDLALYCVLKATPSSPFERWRMTWAGPRRVQPHLVLHVVSNLSGERAAIVAHGGMVEREGEEEREWHAWLEGLLDEACAETSGG